MAIYRTRVVEKEAVLWDGSEECAERIGLWANGPGFDWNDDDITIAWDADNDLMEIETLEGSFSAPKGWYIVRGIKGEFYACEPEIFEASYEWVSD